MFQLEGDGKIRLRALHWALRAYVLSFASVLWPAEYAKCVLNYI